MNMHKCRIVPANYYCSELCERERFMKEPSLLGIFVASQCARAEDAQWLTTPSTQMFCQVNPEGN